MPQEVKTPRDPILSVNDSEHLKLSIGDPVALLNEIADRYQSPERVIMEYIDNSLDDAEAWMRESGCDEYPGPVRIIVTMDSTTRTVRVLDNLRGMSREVLKRIVQNVSQSPKRGNSWLNGRFGFGVHAFRAIAQSIKFRTRSKGDLLYELELKKDDFENISLPPGRDEPLMAEVPYGTEVIIGPLTRESWKLLSPEAIKEAVEQHFEGLLGRKGLTVVIRSTDLPDLVCEAFDYAKVDGVEFQKALAFKNSSSLVKVHLKVSKVAIPGRKARFFAKGRRISNVKDIHSFINASQNRTRVWGHDHLVGYIEVGEFVDPVLTRDDFKASRNRQELYDEVLRLEKDIAAALDDINEAQRDNQMDKLADVMQNVLAGLAREDHLRFRSTTGGSTVKGSAGGAGGSGNRDTSGGSGTHSGTGRTTTTGNAAAGFVIRFAHLPEDFEGRMERSNLVDGVITINIDHPDFKDREQRSRQGAFKVTPGLVWYLAGAISVHYQDELYNRYGRQPERRDQLMMEQFALTCRLESALRGAMKELEQAVNGSEEDVA
ncbi:MAG: ATP-binding protein [Bacillota bacterium]